MKIRVAGIQIGTMGAKPENVDKVRSYLDRLASSGIKPNFVCLPEMLSYLPDPQDRFDVIDTVAETRDGPLACMFSEYARKLKCYVVTGSYIQRHDGKHRNTSLLFRPSGDLLAEYSKLHLFDTPDHKESWFVAAGDHISVVETEFCKIGLIICYDIRFPELLRTLTLKGAELIFCPAAFPIASPSPGYDHWHILTRAAALQNMVYLTAVNQIGFKAPFYFFGRSVIVDPWGIEIATASNQECIISAEIDLQYLRSMRQIRSPLDHRRPELYQL